ncbi:unnamed protein product, partial [Choristocarpus tenellus]
SLHTRRVICATSTAELVLLTISRFSAGTLFPSICIVVVSKCSSSRSYIQNSWLGSVINFEPVHDIHTYFGSLMLAMGVEHSIAHTARYIVASETEIMYDTTTGRAGVLAFLLLFPVVLPMKYAVLRNKLSYEVRKGMHYLAVPLLICISFHSRALSIVGSIVTIWWTLDWFYSITRRTYLIPHPVYSSVGRGTSVHLDLPKGYNFKAGAYAYINCPMISRKEWHPFSLIAAPCSTEEHPSAVFFAEAVGDWTKDLFLLGLKKPRVPLWISAPLPSTIDRTLYYENVLLIGTGAGITPVVSVIERYATSKNIHLLWMVRDVGLITFVEEHLHRGKSTVHVTGNPSKKIVKGLKEIFNTGT